MAEDRSSTVLFSVMRSDKSFPLHPRHLKAKNLTLLLPAVHIAGILLASLAAAASALADEGLSDNAEFRAYIHAQSTEHNSHQVRHVSERAWDSWRTAREAATQAAQSRETAEASGPYSRIAQAEKDADDFALIAERAADQTKNNARRLTYLAQEAADHAQKAAEAAVRAGTPFAQQQANRAEREPVIAQNYASGAEALITGTEFSADKAREEAARAVQAADRAR